MPIQSLKQRAVLKIPSTLFRRIYVLSVGFKIKALKKAFSDVKTKTNSNLAVKVTEISNYSFLTSI